jgi:hypothetical protein
MANISSPVLLLFAKKSFYYGLGGRCACHSHPLISRRSQSRLASSSSSEKVAAAPPKPTYLNVFDRQAKLYQRERAASASNSNLFDYLKDEVYNILLFCHELIVL